MVCFFFCFTFPFFLLLLHQSAPRFPFLSWFRLPPFSLTLLHSSTQKRQYAVGFDGRFIEREGCCFSRAATDCGGKDLDSFFFSNSLLILHSWGLACRLFGLVIFLEGVAPAAIMTVVVFGKSKGHSLSITTFIPPLKVEGCLAG